MKFIKMLHEQNRKYFLYLTKTKNYLFFLLTIAALLGALHYQFADFKSGGVYWFNLDKERNLPTWFSGMLFLLFGLAAMVAYYYEKKTNVEKQHLFKLPELWLGISLIALGMSLDEITILHENLFWREIRNVSSQIDDSMKYLTQWQILFAPVILIVLGYLVTFFTNRFGSSKGALFSAFVGIGMWIFSQVLEGIRQTFINAGPEMYLLQVTIEELLEMFGTIFLIYSIVHYVLDIAFDLNEDRIFKLERAGKLLTKKSALLIGTIILILALAGGIIYKFANIQSSHNAPTPKLFKEAVDK